MLGQSELTILVDPRLPSKIYQGITTEITGEGSSIAPQTDALIQADHVTYEHYRITARLAHACRIILHDSKSREWASISPVTSAPRKCAAWSSATPNRDPTSAELDQMKALVDQAMREGAMGVSTSIAISARALREDS